MQAASAGPTNVLEKASGQRRAEDRGQWSGVRGQRTEDRGQGSEVREDRSKELLEKAN